MRTSLSRALLGVALATSLLASPALAQPKKAANPADSIAAPPVPKKADTPPVVWNIVVGIIIVGAVFGANMIPSRRGHQD